jgi:exonuclease III
VNVNGLKIHIKKHCLANCSKKEDPRICCLQETHLIDRNKHCLRVKGWKKIYQGNGTPKQAEVAILMPDKEDLNLILMKHDEEFSILTIEEIHQKEIRIIKL